VTIFLIVTVSLQEELPGICKAYEHRGHFDEVLALLEAGLSLERAHVRVVLVSEQQDL
jgi:hypothetical protein